MKPRNQWHPSLTDDVIMEACERRYSSLDNPGFCVSCGLEHDGIEPDAMDYECVGCGEFDVFGVEELMLEIA